MKRSASGNCSFLKVVISEMTFILADLAAIIPRGASSNTRHCSGFSDSRFAVKRKISGSGFPFETPDASVITSNRFFKLASVSTKSTFSVGALVAKPVLIPLFFKFYYHQTQDL